MSIALISTPEWSWYLPVPETLRMRLPSSEVPPCPQATLRGQIEDLTHGIFTSPLVQAFILNTGHYNPANLLEMGSQLFVKVDDNFSAHILKTQAIFEAAFEGIGALENPLHILLNEGFINGCDYYGIPFVGEMLLETNPEEFQAALDFLTEMKESKHPLFEKLVTLVTDQQALEIFNKADHHPKQINQIISLFKVQLSHVASELSSDDLFHSFFHHSDREDLDFGLIGHLISLIADSPALIALFGRACKEQLATIPQNLLKIVLTHASDTQETFEAIYELLYPLGLTENLPQEILDSILWTSARNEHAFLRVTSLLEGSIKTVSLEAIAKAFHHAQGNLVVLRKLTELFGPNGRNVLNDLSSSSLTLTCTGAFMKPEVINFLLETFKDHPEFSTLQAILTL